MAQPTSSQLLWHLNLHWQVVHHPPQKSWHYMIVNNYLDPSLPKTFMPTVPECTDCHLKLSSILAEAHSNHKSVTVSSLDLANAYGSVHHSLILRHYNAPQILNTMQALYTGLNAKVIIAEWVILVLPLQKRMYQGDPLPVVTFNTVMNTLLGGSLRVDLGYQFSNSAHQVTPCGMLTTLVSWPTLQSPDSIWTPPLTGCSGLGWQQKYAKLADPHLTLSGLPIPLERSPQTK